FARAQLVVSAAEDNGAATPRSADLTATALFQSGRPHIASVSKGGQVLAVANGETSITVTAAGRSKSISVKVTGVSDHAAIGFTKQVLRILSKPGCNAGACHASQFGKGGFKLSVFASEPANDHLAIARGEIGRRISPIDPARSLLLLKPTMQ